MLLSAPVLLTMFRAGLRIVGAADRAVSQKLRDADVVFPANPKLPFDPAGMTIDAIRQAVEGDAKLKAWLTTQGLTPAYQQLVTAGQPPDAETQFLVNEAINVYFDNQVPGGTSPGHAFERAQETRLEQWLNDPNEPVSPTARFALVLVDVAAEFVAVNPGLVARGSNGEQLVSAFAGRISQLIPDDEKFGPKQRLGGRLLGVILRAGLETATQNRDIIASEKQNQDLIDAIATPIIAQFDGITDISDELQWEDIVDAVVGPAASAAFQMIADNQTAFLGSGFAPGTLLGALTGQLARTIAEDGLADTFSQGGAVALYQAALGVIVDQPGLVAPGGTARDGFIRDLIRDFGTVLRQNPVIGAGERQDFGLALATAALNAFRGNAAQLLGLGDSPLEKVASSALDQVLNGLASGIGGPDPLKSIFSRTQLVSLVETILKEAANQPGLLGNGDELRNIVTALASTIGSAQGKLLTPANWTSLAATVLQQAAINPGRLFGFDLDDPRQELATRAISTFLNQAAADLAGGRAGGGVLFGQTLMRAIETTLIGFVSNPANALKLVDGAADDNLLAALITQVSGAVRTRSLEGAFQFGAAQWQQIYSALLTRLLADTNARFGLVDASGLLTSGGRTLIVEILATVQPGTGATS